MTQWILASGGAPMNHESAPLRYPILIIDDHELFSTSLRMALCEHGFDAHQVPITGIADIQARVRQFRPGLVVLDLDLGRDEQGQWVNGLELVTTLCTEDWLVLVVSGSVDTPGVAAAIAAGAIGSVPKTSSFERLVGTVLTAAAGEPVMTDAERYTWLARHHSFAAAERELSQRLGRLSAREREVLELLSEGRRAGEIAEYFVVSMATVRTQIRAILAKLGVNSQLEAVALVRQSPQW